jgi:hypothetical protein
MFMMLWCRCKRSRRVRVCSGDKGASSRGSMGAAMSQYAALPSASPTLSPLRTDPRRGSSLVAGARHRFPLLSTCAFATAGGLSPLAPSHTAAAEAVAGSAAGGSFSGGSADRGSKRGGEAAGATADADSGGSVQGGDG